MPRRLRLFLQFIAFLLLLKAYLFYREICTVRYYDASSYRAMLNTMEIEYCEDQRMDKTPRNYHFIYLKGTFHNHEYLKSWIKQHKLNVTFYNEKPQIWNDVYQFVNATDYVLTRRPDFFHTYADLTTVEKADYLRYLVVALEGGIYSDTDVKLQVRIGKWLTSYGFRADVNDMDFVIGLEFPHNVTVEEKITGTDEVRTIDLPFQLCQWTFVGAKNSFVFTRVVEEVESNLRKYTVKSIKQNEVMLKTGPVKFTQVVLDTIARYGIPSGLNDKGVPNAIGDLKDFFDHGREITLEIPTEDHSKKLVRGVILPNSAFHLKDALHPKTLVKHFFYGFWKGRNKMGTISKSGI